VAGDDHLEAANASHRDHVAGEDIAEDLVIGSIPEGLSVRQESTVNGLDGTLALQKLGTKQS